MNPADFITPETEVLLRNRLQNEKIPCACFEHLWGKRIGYLREEMATLILEHWAGTKDACRAMAFYYPYPTGREDLVHWTLENFDRLKELTRPGAKEIPFIYSLTYEEYLRALAQSELSKYIDFGSDVWL